MALLWGGRRGWVAEPGIGIELATSSLQNIPGQRSFPFLYAVGSDCSDDLGQDAKVLPFRRAT